MGKINLSSPWVVLYNEISAMFKGDKEVNVVFDEESKSIRLYVDNSDKANAIGYFLNQTRIFGKVTVDILVIPCNTRKQEQMVLNDPKENLNEAFKGNPSFAYAETYNTPFGMHTFCVFRNEVIQYYCDNMFDINGVKSTLMEDIARDVFNPQVLTAGLHFCTDLPDNIGKPLGEWP